MPTARILDPITAEMVLGEPTWIAAGGAGTTNLNFVARGGPGDLVTLWFED